MFPSLPLYASTQSQTPRAILKPFHFNHLPLPLLSHTSPLPSLHSPLTLFLHRHLKFSSLYPFLLLPHPHIPPFLKISFHLSQNTKFLLPLLPFLFQQTVGVPSSCSVA